MNKEIYIDFDGVILNTQVEIDKKYYEHGGVIDESWNKVLENEIDWKKLLGDSKVIGNSLEVLKELYNQGQKTYIFSRVFSLGEAQEKINYLRDNNVLTDFIICPKRARKSEVIIPNKNRILVEDSTSNAMDWKNNGGLELFFTKDISKLNQILELRKYVDYKQLEYDNYFAYLQNLVNNLNIGEFTVSDDTKKDLICLKNICNLNNIEILEQLEDNDNTLNYCNDLSILVKKLK